MSSRSAPERIYSEHDETPRLRPIEISPASRTPVCLAQLTRGFVIRELRENFQPPHNIDMPLQGGNEKIQQDLGPLTWEEIKAGVRALFNPHDIADLLRFDLNR